MAGHRVPIPARQSRPETPLHRLLPGLERFCRGKAKRSDGGCKGSEARADQQAVEKADHVVAIADLDTRKMVGVGPAARDAAFRSARRSESGPPHEIGRAVIEAAEWIAEGPRRGPEPGRKVHKPAAYFGH